MFENSLLLAGFDIVDLIDKTNTITFKIKSRKAKLSDNTVNIPASDNPWRFIINGYVKEDNSQVLETNFGPIINVKRGLKLNIHWVNTICSHQVSKTINGMGSK